MTIKSYVFRHKDSFYHFIHGIFHIIGYIKPPTYHPYFRLVKNYSRAGWWSSKFGFMGKCVQIDSGVIFRGNPKFVEIGDYSYVDTNVQMEVYKSIKIGKHVHICANVHIQSGDEVTIGNYACIANGVRIYASSNTYKSSNKNQNPLLPSMSSSAPCELQCVEHSPIIIEDYAFIGINSVVLPGVRIGKYAVVGAGSIITKDIPPYAIAVGAPTKVVKYRDITKNS